MFITSQHAEMRRKVSGTTRGRKQGQKNCWEASLSKKQTSNKYLKHQKPEEAVNN